MKIRKSVRTFPVNFFFFCICVGQLIAVVTDKLSDSAVIDDLQNAASRGVPVYIILNKRSVEENCFLHQLQHPVSEYSKLNLI